VLDGAAIAAAAVGADEVVICVERGARAAADIVRAVLDERRQSELTMPMRLVTIPNRYVAGEETALVHFVNGGEAKPTATPPRPFERGVDGRPTLIDNVETLAHVCQIARFGPEWFQQCGTAEESGTTLFTINGAVERPGVREAPIGSSLRQLIKSSGGDLTDRSAVLIGGYYGTWITGSLAAATPLSNTALRTHGASLGCGAIVVLPPDRCGIAETARIMNWMAGESAGQCGPCANGLPALADALGEVARGRGTSETMARIERWAGQVDGRGGCRFPDGVVRLLRSALTVFAEDLRDHLSGTPCRASTQPSLLRFPTTASEPWR
jgi:NADH:ubiquinone oxidoreductase subunit F (NADH-binding)